MNSRLLGLAFFIAALAIFSLTYAGITGYAVLGDESYNSPFYAAGFGFLIAALFLLVSRQSLDAIIIPTGGGEWDPREEMYSEDRDRAAKALEHAADLKSHRYFVISGNKGDTPEQVREGQSYSIYKFLRRHGVKPGRMLLEGKSHDTLENVLYSLKKIKKTEEKQGIQRPWNIAFVSYPDHLKRFGDFYKAALKKGLVKKGDFEFHEIKTHENPDEKGYEASPVRRLMHAYKLNTIGRYKSKEEGIKYVDEPDPVISFIRKAREFIAGK